MEANRKESLDSLRVIHSIYFLSYLVSIAYRAIVLSLNFVFIQAKFFNTPHLSTVHEPSHVFLISNNCSISFC